MRPKFCAPQIFYDQFGPQKHSVPLGFLDYNKIIFIQIFWFCLPPGVCVHPPTSIKWLTSLNNKFIEHHHHSFDAPKLVSNNICIIWNFFQSLMIGINEWNQSLQRHFCDIYTIWRETQIIQNRGTDIRKKCEVWGPSKNLSRRTKLTE